MKKIIVIVLCSFFLLAGVIHAQEQNKINIYFFWQPNCPHCTKEKPFLENLVKQNSYLALYSFDISADQNNIDLLAEIGKKFGIAIRGVPFTLVGENYFIGWYNEQTTGVAIQQAVNFALSNDCRDIVNDIENPNNINILQSANCKQDDNQVSLPQKIILPILGEVTLKNISLPVLTVVMGMLDGFNPCAMWTLLFLISLLLGMKNRKRMWILGTVFIFTSAFVYFLFMSAWLNLILFLGFVLWLRIIIGTLALLGGGYNLKEFIVNKSGGCSVTSNEKRQKVFEKIKVVIGERSFWLAVGGMVVLALMVNLVELICSAGLPAVYTQVLALTALTKIQYYAYIALYIFFFMLDDLFVFFMAMITLEMTGVTTKYTRYTKLIGGLLMLIIGLLLIFKPSWLMFG